MWKRELIKNKLYSVVLMVLGGLSVPIEYDATAFIFTLMVGIPPCSFQKRTGLCRRAAEWDEQKFDEL